MACLGLVLPSASFAQTPTVDSLNVVPSFFTAAVSANVAADGGSPITGRGVVFAETAANADPLIGGTWVTNLVASGTGTLGTFNRGIGGLQPNRNYSIRAYATNGNGAGYTAVETFTTPCPARIFSGIPRGSVGTSYDSYANALGGFGWDDYTISGGALPPGMGIEGWSGHLYGAPTAAGAFAFTVQVVDQTNGCVGSSALYSLEVDALHVVPRKVVFASEVVLVPSPPKTVTIVNNGPGDVNLSLPLTASAPFTVSSTSCVNPLPSTQSCTVELIYTPTSATAHNGAISIGHDQGGGPVVVPLKGAGTVASVQQVYSSNEDSDSVTVIDPVTNAVRTVVPVGNGPGGLAVLPGGAKVYVPNQLGNTVSVITTSPTHSVTATVLDVNFSYPMAAAATPSGDAVWVANRDNDTVTVIETLTDAVVASLSDPCVDGPRGVVANPVNHEMYVLSSNQDSGQPGAICVFDRVSRVFLRRISVGGFPESAVVLPNGTALYVITGNGGTAVRVALPSGAASAILGVYGHQLAMTADGSRIYVAREGDGLAVINTADNSVATIPITGYPSTIGVAVHDAAGRVFVSDTNRVFVLDLATNTELPSSDLPIVDSSFQGARVLATAKSGAPGGVAPTVTNLANGTPGAVATAVSADVTANGGAPIFERGFAYSTIDTTPEPNEPDVVVLPVPGGVGSMNAVLTGLAPGVTYHYQAYAKNISGTGLSGPGSFLNEACPSIGIAEASVPSGFQGLAYNATFTVTGAATGPFAFEYLNLPSGLTAVGNSITGIPSGGASVEIFVKVTDTPSGCSAENIYSLVIGSVVAPGDLLISEFRTRGPGGALDEYVEIANRTNADIVIIDPAGTGFSIGRPGVVLATIPNDTVIKKGGHWLAVGASFSLWSYGGGADGGLSEDIPDDMGIGLFKTASAGSYSSGPTGTLLDAVGGSAETDGIFYEGTKLAELGATDPPHQTAWVRRINNMAVLVDVNDNDRDFTFVATDAGSYGPSGEVAAVLGGPNPEDTYSVRDVLNAELPVSLIEPARGEQQYPNREVVAWAKRISYHRVFTNNTGGDIGALSFKVINLTTANTRQTLSVQGDVRVGTGFNDDVWVESLGAWIPTTGAQLDSPGMYQHYADNGWEVGGLNSRLSVPLGGEIAQEELVQSQSFGECGVFAPGESLPVNFYLHVESSGRYLFVLVPQISGVLEVPAIQARKAPALCGGKGGGGPRG